MVMWVSVLKIFLVFRKELGARLDGLRDPTAIFSWIREDLNFDVYEDQGSAALLIGLWARGEMYVSFFGCMWTYILYR